MSKKEKVLVTGGLGYIGSHTVVELAGAGYEPVIIDNLANSELMILDQIEKITGQKPEFHNFDLCDSGLVHKFFAEHEDIEKVIHFAAYKAVGESVKLPLKYYKNNLESLLNILAACEGRKLDLVFSSSCTVYGNPEVLPVTEEAPTVKAESPYGNTKQIGEEILADYARANKNFRAVALRYFNPVGAHESGHIGELPQDVPQNLVPFVTQSAIGLRGPITVHGNDYDTTDGTCIRDYIHVVDLADAHIKALEKADAVFMDANFAVLNVGTGLGSSVLDVINTFEKVNDLKLDYKIGPRRDGDVVKVWADPSKAKEVLGWKPKYTLEDMMRSAWQWEKNLKNIKG